MAKSAWLPRASNLEASGAELAIIPSESFLDEIHSNHPLGSDSEGPGEDLEASPMMGRVEHSGKVLETAKAAFM